MIEGLNLPISQFLRALGGRKGLYLSPRRREQQEEGKEPQTGIKSVLRSDLGVATPLRLEWAWQ